MDHNTREILGRLTGWCVLGGAVVLAVVAVGAELRALPATLRAARARAVMPDAVSRVDDYARLVVMSDPPLDPRIPPYYWQDRQGRLGELYVGRSGIAYFPLPDDVGPGRLEFHAIVNPYSAHAPGWGGSSVFLYPPGTPLVVIDTRALVTGGAGGGSSSATSGEPGEPGEGHLVTEPGVLWLARLADVRPVAYLTPVPLDAYDACRRLLRQAPAGAVLPAAGTWETPAGVEAMLDALRYTRKRMGGDVTVLTTDGALADAARQDAFPVVLVGAQPAPLARGVNAPDWNAAYTWLTDPAR